VAFCGYHNAFNFGQGFVSYSVIPDLNKPGCIDGCESSHGFNTFQRTMVVSSHEVIESITDPLNQPLTWYDDGPGEIADLCDSEPVPDAKMVANGVLLYVEKGWSNLDNACISSVDFRYFVSNLTVTVPFGQSQTANVTVAQLGSSTQLVNLSLVVPPGLLASVSPTEINSGVVEVLFMGGGALGSYQVTFNGQGRLYTKSFNFTVNVVV